jgi:hypothetical protein
LPCTGGTRVSLCLSPDLFCKSHQRPQTKWAANSCLCQFLLERLDLPEERPAPEEDRLEGCDERIEGPERVDGLLERIVGAERVAGRVDLMDGVERVLVPLEREPKLRFELEGAVLVQEDSRLVTVPRLERGANDLDSLPLGIERTESVERDPETAEPGEPTGGLEIRGTRREVIGSDAPAAVGVLSTRLTCGWVRAGLRSGLTPGVS